MAVSERSLADTGASPLASAAREGHVGTSGSEVIPPWRDTITPQREWGRREHHGAVPGEDGILQV